MKRFIYIIACLCLFSARAGIAKDISVAITEPSKGTYQIEGILKVVSPPRVVWEVLTDYDHMPEFLSSMTHSQVRQRRGHSLILEQSAIGSVFIFKKKILVFLKVDEKPFHEIDFEDISHTDFEFYEGSWQLEHQPGVLVIHYEVTAKPLSSTPRFLARGAFLKTAQKLLEELQTEIKKRG